MFFNVFLYKRRKPLARKISLKRYNMAVFGHGMLIGVNCSKEKDDAFVIGLELKKNLFLLI
jgi:hypothetical protein